MDPRLISAAFDLGTPRGEMIAYQYTSFETWRLETSRGSFLIKRLWAGEDPPWWNDLERMMRFERAVMDSGIRTATPIEPAAPLFGFATRIGEAGVFRVYEWVDHRPLESTDEVTDWVGQTLATLHRLAPLSSGVTPNWRWLGVFPRETWTEWLVAAQTSGRQWTPALHDNFAVITDLTARLRSAIHCADDLVITHGDFEPYNVLLASDGPIIVDWESVGSESATLEVGRAAYSFGYGGPERIRRILQSYRRAGGHIASLGSDLLIRRAALKLVNITEPIKRVLEHSPYSDRLRTEGIDQKITDRLERLGPTVAELTRIGSIVDTK